MYHRGKLALLIITTFFASNQFIQADIFVEVPSNLSLVLGNASFNANTALDCAQLCSDSANCCGFALDALSCSLALCPVTATRTQNARTNLQYVVNVNETVGLECSEQLHTQINHALESTLIAQWTVWSEWSATCGNNTCGICTNFSNRTRTCLPGGDGSAICPGVDAETIVCGNVDCINSKQACHPCEAGCTRLTKVYGKLPYNYCVPTGTVYQQNRTQQTYFGVDDPIIARCW